MRGGQSSEHRILHRGLKSGTVLEILEEYPETGYSRVRTEDGLEGYLQTQYLTDEPIARTRLEEFESQLMTLEAKYQQALLRLQDLGEGNTELSTQSGALQEQLAETTRELDELQALSADVIAIDADNKRLTEEREELLFQIELLQQRTQQLQANENQRWFLTGTGVVLLGLLFGFWLARRLYRRQSQW